MKVLIVDDEPMSHKLISAVLRVMGDVEVVSAMNGLEALEVAERDRPDLIISDISMPTLDGLHLCQRIRAHATLARTPIILLTARGEAEDKYEGFLQGADDYLIKPFDLMELQLRIKALLRRAALPANEPAAPALQAGPLALNEKLSTATLQGHEVRLTASEFALLRHLVLRQDELVSAEVLLVEALGYPPKVGNPQTVHSHVRNLRNKFRLAGLEPDFLTSSWQGYVLSSQAPAPSS